MAKKEEKHELATVQNGGLNSPSDIPDFLKGTMGLGNEGVKQEDITIPRLGIIQSQSPEIDADDPSKFIEGAKMGQIFNTLTREVYDKITVVDTFFRKEFAVFVKRTAGGGFRGSYPTQGEAVAAVKSSDNPMDLEIIETGLHFCVVVNPETKTPLGEVVIPMTSTKLKVSRAWNSMIMMQRTARFAGLWTLSTKKEKNDKGTYFNFAVSPAGWVSPDLYEYAKGIYEAVSTGQKDVARDESPSDAPNYDEGGEY